MNNDFIIYNSEDGKVSIALYKRDGEILLNQYQLSQLFDTSVPNISQHISNILSDKELDKSSVIKNYLTTEN